MNKFVFTCGDVNGIGPEICVKTFNKVYNPKRSKLIFCCPKNVFIDELTNITPNFQFEILKKKEKISGNAEIISVIDIGNTNRKIGKPTFSSGKTSYKSIEHSLKLINNKSADAVITAPISKTAFKLAKIEFPGHTELLADWFKSKSYLMLFYSKELTCSLVTIHEPLKKVSLLLTKNKIVKTIQLTKNSLINDFKTNNPKIAVLGFNPHAGENGRIGDEELTKIIPAIESFNDENVQGPFVPDAFFANRLYKKFDCFIAMYHDQALIPFKMMNFEKGVNFTAGLPIVRTSPDHGTAFDIAGKNTADASSMIEAFKTAEKIQTNRSR
ncbi:MAG: 4-hydroxythreonine-4-phosphate dehydrogenase PdxA [Ignavibacteria bacterium]|jgi:4-hydroxythreonine-4-phosphate dehydrogenase